MPKRSMIPPPTDEEILALNDVPVQLAARYIGWSSVTITNALKQERAPFGFAAQNPNTGSWTYNISPGALVRYKRGDLPTYRLNEVINLAAEGFEKVIDAKLSACANVFAPDRGKAGGASA